MFDATKERFKDITFDSVNLDESRDLGEKYGIHSIPRVVFLDASNNVLANQSPPRDESSFAELVKQYH